MGTRSIVAVSTGEPSQWRGRYVHWDGYLEGVGAELVKIVARDGVPTAVKTLTEDHWGWSIIDADQVVGDLAEYQRDGRFSTVTGYGVPYNKDTEGGDQPDEWIDWIDFHESWCEYVYVIQPDGKIRAYSIAHKKLELITTDLAEHLANQTQEV